MVKFYIVGQIILNEKNRNRIEKLSHIFKFDLEAFVNKLISSDLDWIESTFSEPMDFFKYIIHKQTCEFKEYCSNLEEPKGKPVKENCTNFNSQIPCIEYLRMKAQKERLSKK